MYTNYLLESNPYFKMTKGDFNNLLKSMVKEPIPNSKPVKVGITVRTITSNLVAQREDEIVDIISLNPNLGEEYFNIIANIQHHIIKTYGELDFEVIKDTVLMPVGAFEDQGDIIIYCVLIIQDTHVEAFSTNDLVKFEDITKINLNNLNDRSIIVLPTLTTVSNK